MTMNNAGVGMSGDNRLIFGKSLAHKLLGYSMGILVGNIVLGRKAVYEVVILSLSVTLAGMENIRRFLELNGITSVVVKVERGYYTRLVRACYVSENGIGTSLTALAFKQRHFCSPFRIFREYTHKGR